MAKPGVILRRPVGSDGPFRRHADLPTHLVGDEVKDRPEKPQEKPGQQRPHKIGDEAARKAAAAFERAERQRESERRKEEAARTKERTRRQHVVAKAQAALEKGKREHDAKASSIAAERVALEKRVQAEEVRWEKQKEKLENALRQGGE
jgi:colicin import membrane protein